MSQNNAYYDCLNMDAVKFSEACLIIRARIVEAAETMTYIQVRGVFPAYLQAFWVEYESDNSDNVTRCFYRPDAKAISRAEEVFYKWFPLVSDDKRPLLCAYAFRQAVPRKYGSIREFCKKNAIVRRTFERHVTKTIEDVAKELFKKSQLLQQPNWSRVLPVMPNSRINFDRMATVTYWHTDDAKPAHRPELQEVA